MQCLGSYGHTAAIIILSAACIVCVSMNAWTNAIVKVSVCLRVDTLRVDFKVVCNGHLLKYV